MQLHSKIRKIYLNLIIPSSPGRGQSVVQHGSPSSSLQQHSFMSRGLLQRHVSGMPIGARESIDIWKHK